MDELSSDAMTPVVSFLPVIGVLYDVLYSQRNCTVPVVNLFRAALPLCHVIDVHIYLCTDV